MAERGPRQAQRHEGSGIGDGIRLRERKKALKGEPHERIWHEIGPVSDGAEESVMRLRKPEDAGSQERQSWLLSRCPTWKDAIGDEISREELLRRLDLSSLPSGGSVSG